MKEEGNWGPEVDSNQNLKLYLKGKNYFEKEKSFLPVTDWVGPWRFANPEPMKSEEELPVSVQVVRPLQLDPLPLTVGGKL